MNNDSLIQIPEPQPCSELLLFINQSGKVHNLPVELLDRLEKAMCLLSDTAPPGQARTLRQHFGAKAWEAIASSQAKLAGRCVAYLTAHHRVPFKAMGIDPKSKAQMYARI